MNVKLWWGKGLGVGGDLVTFWLIGGALTQPGCNEKPCSPKIFKANQIAWFFYTKFKHHDQHQNQHHDWNLLNKFWLLITFGVLPKVSLKVKFFKIHNIILPSIDMSDRNVNPKVTQIDYVYFLIQFLLLIIIYILFKLQMPDKKICKVAFVFLFTYSKMQSFLTDISLLIVSLFEKHNRLFSYSILCFATKN